MPRWGKLPPDDIARVVAAYRTADFDTLNTLAETLGIKVDSLARYARFTLQYVQNPVYSKAMDILEHQVNNKSMIRIPQYDVTPRLTDLLEVDTDTDAMEWLSWLHDNRTRDLTVSHDCDIHFPFHDIRAMELATAVKRASRPDLYVVGSDQVDFYNLTSFAIDPDERREDSSDVLTEFETFYNAYISLIHSISPDAPIVYIMGNHEIRFIRFIKQQAPQLRKRLMRDFISIVRANGRVWWLGAVEHVRIGSLQVEHGIRHNEHVAKSRLIDEGGQVHIWMGHVHKKNVYELGGADYTVEAISSGAQCLRQAHYREEGRSLHPGRKWTQGTVISTMNPSDRQINFEAARFTEKGYDLQCFFRGQRHTSHLQSSNDYLHLRTPILTTTTP